MRLAPARIPRLLAATLATLPLLGLGANCLAANAASTPAPSSGTDILAQAGLITLASADIRALVAGLPSSERAAATTDLNSLEQVVEADLVRRSVLAEAKASGFDREPDTIAQLDRLRDEAVVRLWVASKAAVPADYPSEAQVQAAYAANQQSLAAPTQYHLARIFISAPDGGDPTKLTAALRKAAELSSKLATADFAQLATQQSEDPGSASHGGDLGTLPDNRMRPDILAAVRSLTPGQVVGPVKTTLGLHFLKLLDKKPGAIATLAQAHESLVAALRSQRATQLQQAYLNDYHAKLGVTVNQIELAKLQRALPR